MSALQGRVDNLRKAGYYVAWTYYPNIAKYQVVVANDDHRACDFVSAMSICDYGGEFTILATINKLVKEIEDKMNERT